jgi:hypothetical protein
MKTLTALPAVVAIYGLIALWTIGTGAGRLMRAGATRLHLSGKSPNGAAGED